MKLIEKNMLVVDPKHKALDHHPQSRQDNGRLHPHTRGKSAVPIFRRYSQSGSSLFRKSLPPIQESKTSNPSNTPIEGLGFRSGSGHIQQALDDMLVALTGPVNTSRSPTAEQLPALAVRPQRMSLPERLLSPLLSQVT